MTDTTTVGDGLVGQRYRRNGLPGRSPCVVEEYVDGAWRVVQDHGGDYEAAHWHVTALNVIAERDQLRQQVEALRAEAGEWEDVNSSEWVFAENGARWAVCDNGDVAVAYPDLGARAPLPNGWRLQKRRDGGV